jgi:hypothetical protein
MVSKISNFVADLEPTFGQISYLVLAGDLHGGHVVAAEEDKAHLGPLPRHRGAQTQPHQSKPCPKVRVVLQGGKKLAHFLSFFVDKSVNL